MPARPNGGCPHPECGASLIGPPVRRWDHPLAMTTQLSLPIPPAPFRVLVAAVAALAALAALVATAPAQAHERARAMRSSPAAADRALDRARAVATGRFGNGRELTLALAELESRRPALSAAERREADGLLARPTDPADGGPGGPYTADPVSACSTHFCFHWIDDPTNVDAPSLEDGDGDGYPDYVNLNAVAFEQAYAVEVGQLGWRPPKPDAGHGGNDRSDVYIKDIGDFAYGYVSRDPGQAPVPENGTRYAYLVMDDDYSADQFPRYGGDPEKPLMVTAAHEFNHVLQNAYDSFEDKWMFESTATWMEEVVHPDVDDYHGYVPNWAQRSLQPLTAPDNDKIYGSAIWNRWLQDGLDVDVPRRAWEVSFAERSFAPWAYDRAIRERGGAGFMSEFVDFAVATAEWGAAGSGIHEGELFPSMGRITSGGQVLTLPVDGTTVRGQIDHTGYALFNVAASTASSLTLTGALPAGTAGAIALVGRSGAAAGGAMTQAVTPLPSGGRGTAVLQNPAQFARITAVIVNADPSYSGFAGGDWTWTKDDAAIELSVTAAVPDGGGSVPDTGGQAGGTGTGTVQQPVVTPVAPPVLTPALALTAGAQPKLAKLARAGALKIAIEAGSAGSAAARATMRVGSRTIAIGSGRATLAAAGKAAVTIRLTPKGKAALKRARRALKVSVRVVFTPAGGAPVTKTLSLTLRK
jgi:hypothetical protein